MTLFVTEMTLLILVLSYPPSNEYVINTLLIFRNDKNDKNDTFLGK